MSGPSVAATTSAGLCSPVCQLFVNTTGVRSRYTLTNFASMLAPQDARPLTYTVRLLDSEGGEVAIDEVEVAPFGIRVACIEPGNFATGFTAQRRRVRGWVAQSPYAARSESSVTWMEQDEKKGLPPSRFAAQVRRIVERDDRRFRHLAIAPIEHAGLWLRRVLPFAWYERLFRHFFHVA